MLELKLLKSSPPETYRSPVSGLRVFNRSGVMILRCVKSQRVYVIAGSNSVEGQVSNLFNLMSESAQGESTKVNRLPAKMNQDYQLYGRAGFEEILITRLHPDRLKRKTLSSKYAVIQAILPFQVSPQGVFRWCDVLYYGQSDYLEVPDLYRYDRYLDRMLTGKDPHGLLKEALGSRSANERDQRMPKLPITLSHASLHKEWLQAFKPRLQYLGIWDEHEEALQEILAGYEDEIAKKMRKFDGLQD